MRRSCVTRIVPILLVVLVLLIAGCSQSSTSTESDASEAASEQLELSAAEDAVGGVDAGGEGASDADDAGNKVGDADGAVDSGDSSGKTNEDDASSEDLDVHVTVYEQFNVEEYNYNDRNASDFPSGLHVKLAGDTKTLEDDIAYEAVVHDLWNRIVRMWLLPAQAKEDNSTSRKNTFTFSWDDGRTQTYVFKGTNMLARDGLLYPIYEDEYADGEYFGGPVVRRIKNPDYPGQVIEIARMLVEDSLGWRDVFIVMPGGITLYYDEERFEWDADGDGYTEDYVVHVDKGGEDAETGILIQNSWNVDSFCRINGATRLYTIDKLADETGTRLYINYRHGTAKDGETRRCEIRMRDGALEVSYL